MERTPKVLRHETLQNFINKESEHKEDKINDAQGSNESRNIPVFRKM
jgi:hypothetical protein